MSLNPKMVLASDLQSLFRDKDTSLPLSGGIITFYSDADQSTLKPVYQLTGTNLNDYRFSELPNPITLSSIGTMQDALGNDIVAYYYPFSGVPDDDSDIQELYYVTVDSSASVRQFDRHAWPYGSGGGTDVSENDEINFIPNGQFLAHANGDAQASGTVTLTSATLDVKYIAQGGWTIEDQNGHGGTYTADFTTLESGAPYLNDFPATVLDYSCTVAATGIHQIGVKWRDVNMFEGADLYANLGDTPYTFCFFGKSNDASTYSFDVRLIKYYGTGGSPSEDTLIDTVSIAPNAVQNEDFYHNFSVTFGDNTGKTVGARSYVQIVLRPSEGVTTTFDVRLTNFVLAIGTLTLTSFPPMTNAQMLSQGVTGWMPTPATDGSDLYLPLVLTPQGVTFDHSVVGQIIGKQQLSAHAVNNELLMNGQPYVASEYSSLGIPYQRLMDYLLLNSPAVSISAGAATIPINTVPLTGTGSAFVTLFNEGGQPTHFLVQMNTAAAAGSATQVSASITIAATSANNYYTATVASVPSAGDYWTFTAPTVVGQPNSGLVYNVWYSVDGAGTAPASPTGDNIEVELVTGDTTTTTASRTIAAVNRYQFFIPDARGYFWRGLDTGTSVDPDSASRTLSAISFNGTAFTGANLGSLQSAAYLNHSHTATTTVTLDQGNAAASGSTSYASGAPGAQTYSDGRLLASTTVNASTTGGNETRPVNLALYWYIKY